MDSLGWPPLSPALGTPAQARRTRRVSASVSPDIRRWGRLWLWGLALTLPQAEAHGGTDKTNLQGVTICLDPSAVHVQVEGVSPQRTEQLQQPLAPALTQTFGPALQRAGVKYERRASCLNQEGLTRLRLDVRYLDPKAYIGFGDQAYSYTVSLKVNVALTPSIGPSGEGGARRQFSVGWADIHSEGATGQPVVPVLAGWGEEQMRDLIVIWRRDNPTLQDRVAQIPPLGWTGLGLGSALAGLALVRLRRRRQA